MRIFICFEKEIIYVILIKKLLDYYFNKFILNKKNKYKYNNLFINS